MPDLPPLPFRPPTPRPRTPGRGGRAKLEGPGAREQARRLGPALSRLTRSFEQGALAVTDDPAALNPEEILVLEVAGELGDFVKAIRKVPGLELLADELDDAVEPDEFAAIDQKDRRRPYDRQLYLVASDQVAWRQILSLWQRFQAGQAFPRGLTPFRHLFSRLRELRPWNDLDRLERTGVIEVWQRELAGLRDELVEFEAELWLRADPARRAAATRQIRESLVEAGGEFVDELVMPEIGYHGLLGRAPAWRLLEAAEHREVRWLKAEGVRFFHAVGQIAAISPPDRASDRTDRPAGEPPTGREPQVALLDGLPLVGHRLLSNRVVVDDPDGWEATTPVARRVHGTAMASLIVHGDLGADDDPIPSPLYARPILRADAPAWVRDAREELPRDRLAVDLVHAAVVRLFEGEAVAPEVRVVVLAIGDATLQFDRFVSPLARLLDWLSFRLRLLFVVSAGNHLESVTVPADIDLTNPQELQHEVLCALHRDTAFRRLLSPAESVNAITIGAAHADSSTATAPQGVIEPIVTPDLSSVISARGLGMRRGVKPDVLLPGGRELLRSEPEQSGNRPLSVVASNRPPGAEAAAPGQQAADRDRTAHVSGTSVATALAGHESAHLIEQLRALRATYGNDLAGADFDAVLVKAALAHSARWGTASTFINRVLEELDGGRTREGVLRSVGYGRVEPRQALRCDDHLVTLIDAGLIAADTEYLYRFPLPASLASQTVERRVIVTLAWFTPVNPSHRLYRRAALKVEPASHGIFLGDRVHAGAHSARRGTLQHDVLEGTKAQPYVPGSSLDLVVSCRADAGALDVQVPYGLVVSLEVPVSAQLAIYNEVRQGLQASITVRSASG